MINNLSSFILGFLSTCGAFILSLLLVVGGKMLFISFTESFPKKGAKTTNPKPKVIKRRKTTSTIPKPVRSIEIDPEQIDKIYVRKTS